METEVIYKELERKISLADLQAQYDMEAIYLLSEKIVLAHIISGVIEEMKGMPPEEIVPYIEGTPEVAAVKLLPGETNSERNSSIEGSNVSSKIPGEGSHTFDVRFSLNLPDGNREYQLLVNVEAQKSEPSGYDIPERGAFYTARMISAQYGPVFTGKDYSKLKKVYSIWIVMNCSESNGNTIMRYYTEKENVLGKEPKQERYNLSEVIVIRLTKNLAPKGKTELKLHRFLGTIFSDKLEVDEKKAILKNEFNLPMGSEMKRKVTTVCNLSEAIVEDAMNRGEERGEQKKLCEQIQRKIEKGKPLDVIADELEETVENIRELYEELLKKKQ